MPGEAKKLHWIEEILKINNDALLIEMEAFLSKKNSVEPEKKSLRQFSGLWTQAEANEMMKTIKDSCENIDSNGWK